MASFFEAHENSLYFLGLIYFLLLYFVAYRLLILVLPPFLRQTNVVTFSMRLVGSLQSFAACLAGVYIIVRCRNDIMNDRCWLANAYAKFCTVYFFFDLLFMYLSYLEQKRGLELRKKDIAKFDVAASDDHRRDLADFFHKNKLMTFHHLVLPLVFGPCVVLRDGAGDFFVGALYLVEASNPFVNLRAVLRILEYHKTFLYAVNGVLMMAVFFLCRIAIFPYLYHAYAGYKGISVMAVPLVIPQKCNMGCLILMSMQIYWFTLMVKGLIRVLRSR